MEAVLCPICKGSGQVCKGMENTHSCSYGAVFTPVLESCHGCGTYPNGKGWIVIPKVILFPVKNKPVS